jgi:hypothetical protein
MANKRNVLIMILVIIILILAAIIVYAFAGKPAYTGFVVKNQNIGYNIGYQTAFLNIMQRAATCQPIPLTFGNQTINIIAVGCLQQQQTQPQQ